MTPDRPHTMTEPEEVDPTPMIGRSGGIYAGRRDPGPQYMIETQCFGWHRWAWAISLPDPQGPSLLHVEYDPHPFSTYATETVGGWNRRISWGWAWSQERAVKKAERAIDRHKRQRAGTAASEQTYAIKETW